MHSRVSLALSTLVALVVALAACGKGAPPPAPRAPEPLVVGKGSAAPSAPAVPAYAAEDDVAVPIVSGDAIRGSREAYVTIVVFSDFQCPFCSRLVPTLDRLAEELGPDQLRIVFKNNPLPFHQHARLAAEVGQGVLATAGQQAFWKFHDIAFKSQRTMDREEVLRWASQAGANEREIATGLDQKRWAAKVDEDMSLAKSIGASGTPMSFVNGTLVSGAQPYEKFSETVNDELAKARSLAERGVAKDKLYARLVTVNFKDPKSATDDDDDDGGAAAAAAAAKAQADAKIVWKVPVAGAPVRGNANALVTLVVFSDFQCPFCKRVEPTIDQLRTAYGDKLRVVWKDQPLSFHPRAEPAAELARAARAQKGDAGFWAMHDALFDAAPALEDADLERLAKKVGLDVQKAMSQVKAKTYKRAIETDQELADDVGANGTPTVFVNGRKLTGAQPFDKFKSLVDEELVRAEALVKGGTAKSAVYDAAIKDGKGAPEPERRSIGAPPPSAPFRGAANAKVVIQQIGDYQCPFCARVEPTLAELLKAYPGKIKIVWRDKPLPFHTDAPLAAEAAREAYAQKGNEGWGKMHDLLFANAQALKRSDLDGYAAQLGLDRAMFARALDNHTHKATIDADDKAVSDAGVSGTPAFFIGPFFISGAQPLSKFRRAVDRALAEPAPVAGGPAKTLAGGLVVKDVTVGNGSEVKAGDKISVHYVGTLDGGKEFDSSRKRGTPFSFVIGQGHVIKGWEQGLVGMKVGGTRKLTIPPDLAYGDRGVPPTVPPKSTLHFDVELLSITKP